jgi:hypothetical protein
MFDPICEKTGGDAAKSRVTSSIVTSVPDFSGQPATSSPSQGLQMVIGFGDPRRHDGPHHRLAHTLRRIP